VPRWDAGRFGKIIGFPGLYNASGSGASGITKASFEDNFTTLVVSGAVIDMLYNVLPKFTESHFNLDSSKKSFLLTIWHLCSLWPSSPQIPARDREKETSSKFTTQGNYQQDHTISTLRAFLDTLAPISRFRYMIPPENSQAHAPLSASAVYHSGIAALKVLFPSSSNFNPKHDPRRLLGTKNTDNVNISPESWIQAAEDNSVHRCFAISNDKGYFALVPPTAESGDVLCLLKGGETPYVLRPNSKDLGTFSFVGEAYVVGCMNDALSKLTEGGKLKTFRIR
jgi:hypothetical protein